MPRYIVERTFCEGSEISTEGGAHQAAVDRNSDHGVTWLHSYVTLDRRRTFCVYVAESPEAVRKTARHNSLPIDRITRVEMLDPYLSR